MTIIYHESYKSLHFRDYLEGGHDASCAVTAATGSGTGSGSAKGDGTGSGSAKGSGSGVSGSGKSTLLGLLAGLDQLTWLATSLAGEELRSRLRPLFASVQIQSMQAVAYSMPQVRPGQPDAAARLAEHLTANRARFDLLLTLLRKGGDTAGLESYIKRASRRHLSPAFDTIEIANVKVLE